MESAIYKIRKSSTENQGKKELLYRADFSCAKEANDPNYDEENDCEVQEKDFDRVWAMGEYSKKAVGVKNKV